MTPPPPPPFGWRDWPLLAEALVTLALASAAIRVLPFRRVAAMAGAVGTPHGAGDVDRLRRAVLGWARRVPWRAVCFQQGLALHLLARRRGIATVLHYGVGKNGGLGKDSEKLAAHVWVSIDDHVVIGGEEAPRFACLARFPA